MTRTFVAAALLAALVPASASAGGYTDRATFLAEVPGVVSDDLNSFPDGPVATVFGVEAISSSGNAAGAYISSYGNGFGQAMGGRSAGGGLSNFESVIFAFVAPIYAFGFDVLDLTGDNSEYANIRLDFENGVTLQFSVSETDFDFDTAAFFGYYSVIAIDRVEVWSSNLPNGPIGFRPNQVDNLLLSRTPQVPEPATWAMLIIGFGAIGTAVRRRRLAAA